MALLSTRRLDRETDWPFFHDARPVAPADRRRVRPLADAACRSLWDELVSPAPAERHPMLLPAGHWTGHATESGPNFHRAMSHPGRVDPVAQFLRGEFPWPDDAGVYFVEMRERTIRAPWAVFLRAWPAFLFQDEGPILISLGRPEFAWFGPSGQVVVGRRTRRAAP